MRAVSGASNVKSVLRCARSCMLAAVLSVNAIFQVAGIELPQHSEERSDHQSVRLIFGKCLVWIAVEPAFARLSGRDERMFSGSSVFAGVLIRGTVAAKRDSARLACPEMHPI